MAIPIYTLKEVLEQLEQAFRASRVEDETKRLCYNCFRSLLPGEVCDCLTRKPRDRQVNQKDIWKSAGLCVDCGDKGEFRGLACVCRNGHGIIFGG